MTKDEFIAWDIEDGAVELDGDIYILVKSSGATDAAVATRAQYESFSLNYAHAYADGRIMRYRTTINDIAELHPVSEGP